LDPVELAEHAVVQTFVSETVLMDVAAGTYFSLDQVGGAMLSALLGSGDIAQAAGRLAASGWGEPHEVADDLRALCDELDGLGLIRAGSPA
jgi:hypothetical protein